MASSVVAAAAVVENFMLCMDKGSNGLEEKRMKELYKNSLVNAV